MSKPRKTTIADLERLYNALLSRLDALELVFKEDDKTSASKGTQTIRAATRKGLLPVMVDGTSYSGKECDASLCSNTAIAVGDVVEALDTAGTPLEKGARYNVLQLMSTKLLLLEDVRTKKQCGTYQLDHLKLVERKADKPNEQAEEIGTARQEWLNKGDEASLEEMYKKRFPIGSLVKCVRGSNDFDDDIDVKAGLIYTVEGHVVFGQSGKQWLELKLAGNPCSWSTDRFEPVKPAKPKKGKG